MTLIFLRCDGEGDGFLQLKGLPKLHVVRVVVLGSRGVDELPLDVVPLHLYVVSDLAPGVRHCLSVLPRHPKCHIGLNSILSAD